MNIVIVDNDAFAVMSMKRILESDSEIMVSATGDSKENAVWLYEKYRPDILLLECRMNGAGSAETAEKILKADSEAKILLLSTYSDDELIIKALKAGVRGYILKQNLESIVPALKTVMNGQFVFEDEVVSQPFAATDDKMKNNSVKSDLSEREHEIIKLVSEGFSTSEIATELLLNERQVKNCISEVMERFALKNRIQLAVFYFNWIHTKQD